MKPYIFLLSLILFSCKNEKKRFIDTSKANDLNIIEKIDAKNSKSQPEIQKVNTTSITKKRELSIKVSVQDIKFENLKFKGTKSKMTKTMGIPDSIVEPKYDCGPFSEDWQEMKFYQYFYGNMNFIVFKDYAEVQNIEFIDKEKIEINGRIIKAGMSFKDVAKKLEIELIDGSYFTERIMIYTKEELDEYYILKFKGNKLHQFDRFEPC